MPRSKTPRKPRCGKRIQRALVIPQIINGHDVIRSVRAAIAGIRAQFTGGADTIDAQHLADLNMLWQQVTKVHERAGRTDPPRADILAAHNVLARLNANADIGSSEFESVVHTLERILAQVKHGVPLEIWKDAEVTLETKRIIHGSTEELWMGGVLLHPRKAA
jgi:hypothetical protein